jgi:Rod binding domain-containing protein
MSIDRIAGPQGAPLTDDQKKALEKLHQAAQQMESLFVNMLFKEMRKSESGVSLTGKKSSAEQTFGEMLDEKRSEALAKTDSLGISRLVEQQLRASVVGDASRQPGTPAPKAPPS